MRKKILLFLFSAVFILTGVIAVGCSKDASLQKTYSAVQDFVINITSSETIFSHGNASGYETDFYLDNFKTKNNDDSFVDNDQNYLLLNAVSLEYIYKYYSKLDSLQDKYDFNALYKNATKLQAQYHELKVLSDELDDLGENAQSFVYNGHFSKYKIALRNFVEQAYDTSAALGDLLINKVQITSKLGKEGQNQEDLNAYLDYQNMMAFKDFSDFFMGSCKGQIISNTSYNTFKTRMNTYCSLILKKTNKEVSPETASQLITMSNAFSEERRMYNKAISSFSYYDFSTKYESSIEAYEKADRDADSYYYEIERYMISANGAHQTYYAYLRNNIVNE